MQKETQRIIARSVAMYIIKQQAQDIEYLTMSEILNDEIAGVDQDTFDEVLKLVDAYVEVANVEVYFDDWRVNDDGTVKPEEKIDPYGYEKIQAMPA